MHRKSMEAAHTLSNEILRDKKDGIRQTDESSGDESDDNVDTKPNIEDKDDFRSNSIAALRAKAQEHSARLFGSESQKVYGSHDLTQQQQQSMYPMVENSNSVF